MPKTLPGGGNLVLTRKPNDLESEIFIGDDVVVRVVEVRGDRVRLAIEAPTRMAIRRGELQRRIDADRAKLAPVSVPVVVPAAPSAFARTGRHSSPCGGGALIGGGA